MAEEVNNKTNNEWSKPQNIKIRDIPEFPIEVFPGELKQYGVELAEELQVPVDMVATAMLATVALSNQGKYMIQGKEGWLEPLNIYAVDIAKPSERKSPTMAKIIKPIYEYENEVNNQRKKAIKNSQDFIELYEGKLKKLKSKSFSSQEEKNQIEEEISEINDILVNHKPIKQLRLVVDDITPEALATIMVDNNEKIGIFSSEGGIFETMAGRYNNNIANFDILLKGYSGDRTSIDRKGYNTEILNNPYITIMLFVQPIVIEEVFSNEQFRGKGLCARLLYCYPESKVGNRNVDSKAASKEAEKQYHSVIKKMLKKEVKELQILKLSSDAYNKSQEFATCLEKLLNNELQEIEDWAGKLHGNILRIAGNLHLAANVENDNLIVSKQTIVDAINIGYYYLINAKNIYEVTGNDTRDERIAQKIIKKLKEQKICGEISKHQLYRITRGKYVEKADDINEAVRILEEEGYIRIKKQEEKDNMTGRKKDKILELNPNVF